MASLPGHVCLVSLLMLLCGLTFLKGQDNNMPLGCFRCNSLCLGPLTLYLGYLFYMLNFDSFTFLILSRRKMEEVYSVKLKWKDIKCSHSVNKLSTPSKMTQMTIPKIMHECFLLYHLCGEGLIKFRRPKPQFYG